MLLNSWDERLLFACKKGTELAEKERISLRDLTDVDFIVLKKGGSIRAVSDKKFKERGFIPRISYECDNHYILKRMVEEGLGSSYMARIFLEKKT